MANVSEHFASDFRHCKFLEDKIEPTESFNGFIFASCFASFEPLYLYFVCGNDKYI